MKIRILLVIAFFCISFQVTSAKSKISWWQFWTDPNIKPVIIEMVKEFEAENPNIEVELTDLTWANGHEKIVIAFASGSAPDLVELGSDWIAEFASNELIMDISNYIEQDSSNYQGWSMAKYNNKIYARPWFLGTRVMFANRDLLNQAGYDSNYIPLSLYEFSDVALKINSLGKDIYGFGSNTAEKHRLYKKYLPFFWSFGGQLFSDNNLFCLIASNYGLESLTFYKVLHDSCGYVSNQRGIEDAFLNGKIGFIISGDWLLKRIENEKPDFNLVSTFIPGRKFSGKSFLGGEFIAVNSFSKNKKEAIKFMEFITKPENQIKFCIANRSANPSSIEAQKDDYFQNNPHLQTFIKQIKNAIHPPVDPDWVYFEEVIEEAVEAVLFNDKLPGVSLYKARKIIEEYRSKK